MDFGDALKAIKNGQQVSRAGWNGKGMFLILVSGGEMDHPLIPPATLSMPYVAIKTAQNNVVPWPCSQTDLLATDWELAS